MLLPDFDGKTVPKTDLNIVRRIDTGMFIETTSYGQELSRLTKYDEKDPFTNTGVKIQRAITDYVYLGSTKDHVYSFLLNYRVQWRYFLQLLDVNIKFEFTHHKCCTDL
jgi:hypothetical protein